MRTVFNVQHAQLMVWVTKELGKRGQMKNSPLDTPRKNGSGVGIDLMKRERNVDFHQWTGLKKTPQANSR